ncbi:MAG: hypothetical protein WA666_00860 [Nitrospirota bacterium]
MKVNNLYWGNPKKSDYDLILDYYSGTKINSTQTSSIPLAQFWKNTENVLESIFKELNISNDNADVYFEYPTKSKGSNKASMSDVMIISGQHKIAIEAKYTEYAKVGYETIREWLKNGNKENRRSVLNHWKKMIEGYIEENSDVRNEESESYLDLPYQLLHRTASACFDNPQSAYVVYELFWDDSTKQDLDKFIKLLCNWVKTIGAKSTLGFYAHAIEIKEYNKEVKKDCVFQKMKEESIYTFGDEEFIKI